MKRIIYISVLLIVAVLSALLESDALMIIHGANADGTDNLAVSVGNDGCYATAQAGDYTGACFSCGDRFMSVYYLSNPKPLIMPGFPHYPEIY